MTIQEQQGSVISEVTIMMFHYEKRLEKWQNGELDFNQTVGLFQAMIDSGFVWKLDENIKQFASHLIEQGYCSEPEMFGEELDFEFDDDFAAS